MYQLRSISMFLWFLFYTLIAIDNFNGLIRVPSHLAMVRLSFAWELTVSLIYNVIAIVNIRKIKGGKWKNKI